MMFGNLSGGSIQAATGLAGIAAIGAGYRDKYSKRTYAKASLRAVEAIRSLPEFASVDAERVLALLESPTPSLTRDDLINASQTAVNLDLDAALALRVYQALPFDGDDDATQQMLLLALEAGMRACKADSDFRTEVASVHLTHLVQQVEQLKHKTEKLLQSAISEKGSTLRLTQQLFIGLAKRIAIDVENIDQAYLELERAVEVAAEGQVENTLPSDTDESVKAVFDRVNALNADGQIDTAAALIAEEEERVEESLVRLYDKGIAQAVLTRDPNTACQYELKKINSHTLETAEQFNSLQQVWTGWYQRGYNKGLNFDLEVALELSRATYLRARNADERGTALHNLGDTLQILGDRSRSNEYLEQAVKTYSSALKERLRERVPLDWAMTKKNLGNALQSLGERENSNQRLMQAIDAFNAALEENTRRHVPFRWAMTQNDLGNTLWILGECESGTERLEQAVTAFRAALTVRTRELMPFEWAATQSNLGNALVTLGEREPGTKRLKQAVEAFLAALKERPRKHVPLDWAMAQNNLGNALRTLGERERGTKRLRRAVMAYRAALQEYKREYVPFYWAKVQNNLGNALAALGEREHGTERLEEAIVAYCAALEEHTRESLPLYWAGTMENLARVEKAFADHITTSDPRSHLKRSLAYVEASLEVLDESTTLLKYNKATHLRNYLLTRLASYS